MSEEILESIHGLYEEGESPDGENLDYLANLLHRLQLDKENEGKVAEIQVEKGKCEEKKQARESDHPNEVEGLCGLKDSGKSPALRSYQVTAVESILESLQTGRYPLLFSLPTGGGKTAIAVSVIKRKLKEEKARIVCFVHRDELVHQMHESLLKFGIDGKDISFIKSGMAFDNVARVFIASIQTFTKHCRNRENLPRFSFLIIDEAHHCLSSEYMNLLHYYESVGTEILGLTATPFRLQKGELLSDVFTYQLSGPSITYLVSLKYLVPPRVYGSCVSYGKVTAKGIKRDEVIVDIVKNWKRKWSQRKTLLFCINRAHAGQILKACQTSRITAAIVDGKMRREERKRIFAQSQTGAISILISIDVVSEGVDTTWIDCIILMNPTLSKARHIQQVGRGLRTHLSKQDCIVLDEVGNSWEHGLVHVETSAVFNCKNLSSCKSLVESKGKRCSECERKWDIKQVHCGGVRDKS